MSPYRDQDNPMHAKKKVEFEGFNVRRASEKPRESQQVHTMPDEHKDRKTNLRWKRKSVFQTFEFNKNQFDDTKNLCKSVMASP